MQKETDSKPTEREDRIRLHWKRYGRAYVEMLEDPRIDIYDLAYFVAKTSFGPEARAGITAIARRGKMSVSRAKQSRKKLATMGWMQKSEPGGGDSPAVWDIFDAADNGQLHLLDEPKPVAPGHKVTRPSGGPVTTEPPPGHGVAPKQEDKHEGKKDPKQPGGKHPDEKLFWENAERLWKGLTGQSLEWPAVKGFQFKLTAALTKLGHAELTKRWGHHLAAPMGKKSMLSFFWDLDAWILPPAQRQGQGRGFNQAEGGSEWKPSERGK